MEMCVLALLWLVEMSVSDSVNIGAHVQLQCLRIQNSKEKGSGKFFKGSEKLLKSSGKL